MAVPPIPPPLDQLGRRPFSFYPPILSVEHNEWLFKRRTWSEIQVANTRSHAELWIPQRYFGEVSRIDEPVMIVGLLLELEYEAGQVMPHERRVIEMPKAVSEWPRPAGGEYIPHKPPLSIRLGPGAESRVGLMIGAALILGILATLLVVFVFGGRRIEYTTVLQQDLGLTAQDDYHAVVRRLGQPVSDHWKSEGGERQYRALGYPKLGLTVILMGVDRDKAIYIGAMNDKWRPVHSVKLTNRTDSRALLVSIKRF